MWCNLLVDKVFQLRYWKLEVADSQFPLPYPPVHCYTTTCLFLNSAMPLQQSDLQGDPCTKINTINWQSSLFARVILFAVRKSNLRDWLKVPVSVQSILFLFSFFLVNTKPDVQRTVKGILTLMFGCKKLE